MHPGGPLGVTSVAAAAGAAAGVVRAAGSWKPMVTHKEEEKVEGRAVREWCVKGEGREGGG